MATTETWLRLLNLLLDAPTPFRLVDIERPWQNGFNTTSALVHEKPEPAPVAPMETECATTEEGADEPAEEKPNEDDPVEDESAEDKPAEDESAEDKPADDESAEDKPAEDKPAEDKPAAKDSKPRAAPQRYPPLITLAPFGTATRHRFDARARSLSPCLIKFQGIQARVSANEDFPAMERSQGDIAFNTPALSADPWQVPGSGKPQLPSTLDHLFVCHPVAHIAKALAPIALFRYTCHFNNMNKVV